MEKLSYANLEDYLNSLEPDGTATDHIQREASIAFGVKYGRITSKRKLEHGRKLWAKRRAFLSYSVQGNSLYNRHPQADHPNCRCHYEFVKTGVGE